MWRYFFPIFEKLSSLNSLESWENYHNFLRCYIPNFSSIRKLIQVHLTFFADHFRLPIFRIVLAKSTLGFYLENLIVTDT